MATVETQMAPTGFRPVAEVLPQVVEKLVKALDPDEIVLFGSYAYGQPTPDSDVDLLIIMETDLPEIERYRMVSRVLRPRPFPLDVIVRTPREVEDALQRGGAFIREIHQKGRVLYARR